MTRRAKSTPVRRALRTDSPLLASVSKGMGAIEGKHRACFEDAVAAAVADSLDLDAALTAGHEEENRWDYLLGHRPSSSVVAVEPHSAKSDQVSAVIKKKTAACVQLAGHLRDNARVAAWLWVATGKVYFADTEKARRRLDENGILFVGAQVAERHLAALGGSRVAGQRAVRSRGGKAR